MGGPGKFPAIWSEEGKYLATVLGDALVRGLTEVSSHRPEDPVEYLANFLKTYKNGEVLATQIPKELEQRLKTGRAVTPSALIAEESHIEEEPPEDNEPEPELPVHEPVEPTKNDENEEPPGDSNPEEEIDAEQIAKLDSDVSDSDSITNIDVEEEPKEETQSGTRDDRGQSVLHFAAARPGGASTILAFLQNPSVNLAWRDERSRTARDVAEQMGRAENVRVIDQWVLSLAIAGDKESLQQLLLDGYTSFDICDSQQNHIIDLAEKAGKREVALFLRSVPDFKERLSKLFQAVKSGDMESVKGLTMRDHTLPLALGESGRSPLHVAVLCEEFGIVRFLCEHFTGTLKRGDCLDRTPLHYAMGVEKVEKMTRVLVRNGAKRVVKDLLGRQPSYYFINREEIAKLQREEKSLP